MQNKSDWFRNQYQIITQDKVRLGNLPSRIELHEPLSNEYDVEFFIKYENELDLFESGSKIRKLETLIGEAKLQNCTSLIVDGILASNCCYSVARYAREQGFHAQILFIGDRRQPGLHKLVETMGAEIFYLEKWSMEGVRMGVKNLEEKEIARGGRPFIIPTGGSSAIGTIGALSLAVEIVDQELFFGKAFDHVIFPTGTGGTQVALTIGNYFLRDQSWQLHPVAIANSQEIFDSIMKEICSELVTKFQFPNEIKTLNQSVVIIDKNIEYNSICESDLIAQRRIKMQHGLFFDSIYNLKAFSAIQNLILSGKILKGSRILYILSGGTVEFKLPQLDRIELLRKLGL
jgi:D-cysteine desulfhydrase